ncbi:hypothetical protein [Paenibacillus sp. Marseille-Q4541]|uniref:hypothetical protein n=1 Tax=Paenibacillus sp. Marseille-Q4541 TaxID=2831522 RepID=UPI001BA69877|nr:hypothetical protein [Paenibacillus sp. Marseille-Q4541]
MQFLEHHLIYEESFWGHDVRLRHITQGSNTLVVFFPGQNYSCELPVLHYAVQSATSQGMDALILEYGYQSARVALEREHRSILEDEVLQTVRRWSEGYEQLVFVSKSLGTLLAGYTAKHLSNRNIRHLYLTPLDSTLTYMQHSAGMVIYGTKDSLFSEESRAKLVSCPDLKIYKVPEAGHGLEISDPRKSAELMSGLVEEYIRFFSSLVEETYHS